MFDVKIFNKNLTVFLVFLSLLFNIQLGFTHDVEHINHDHHESALECEDCLLKHHLVKATNLNTAFDFKTPDHISLSANYLINNNIVYTFVAYQSRAP
jgi:hypothetical protein